MKNNINIIYELLYGSNAYGTATDKSDRDIRGIFLPTIDEFILMTAIKDIKPSQTDMNAGIVDDYLYYPIDKFFRLALESNPSVLEWLFVGNNCILKMTDAGKFVRNSRLVFLSKRIYYRFRGYAFSEFSALTKLTGKTGDKRKDIILKTGYSPKNAMNVIRLMEQGIELLSTGNIILPRPNSQDLLKILQGKMGYQQIVDRFSNLEKELDMAFENSKLPNEPRYGDANKLLIKIVKDFNKEHIYEI